MKKKQQCTVGVFGAALIFLLALSGCPGPDEDNGGGDGNVGTNEVSGKTFYLSDSKTVFAADLTFEVYTWWTVDYDTYEEDWELSAKGTYKYNSTAKTVTVTITHIKTNHDDPMLVNGNGITRIYTYEITSDGALLGQEAYTNKGTDELKGKTYTLTNMMFGDDTEYTFAATGNTYSFTSEEYDPAIDDFVNVVTSGTYYYDSGDTRVWLRPTVLRGVTMAAFYNKYDADEYYGIYQDEDDAVKKASETNTSFTSDSLAYDPEDLTLIRIWGGF
jgi:hypothetical protein